MTTIERPSGAELAAAADVLVRAVEGYQDAVRALAPYFAPLHAAVTDLRARLPGLFVEAAPVDPFERAMQAKRLRSSGPPARRLDGIGR